MTNRKVRMTSKEDRAWHARRKAQEAFDQSSREAFAMFNGALNAGPINPFPSSAIDIWSEPTIDLNQADPFRNQREPQT